MTSVSSVLCPHLFFDCQLSSAVHPRIPGEALCSVEEFSCPLVVVGEDLGEDERFEPEWLKCPRPSWGVGHWK